MDRNVAVAGCGYWGKNLVRVFAGLGALHTMCDSSPEVLSGFDSVHPDIHRETSYDHVLANEEVKGVAIASPAALHYSMARQALLAGKDVFVEKPLSLTARDGQEVVDLAGANDRVLMVGHILEHHPAIVKLKEMVGSGELGKIYYVHSTRLNLGKFRTEENILWSFAPHDISVILLLLNEMPFEVAAHGGCYLHKDIADVTVTTMRFASGVRAHIFVNWLNPYKEQKLVVVGEKKMAVFDDLAADNKLQLYEHEIRWIDGRPVPNRQEPVSVEFTMAEPLGIECRHFIQCMETRQRPKVDGRKGLQVLKILECSQLSLESGGRVVSVAKGDLA